MEPEAMTGTAGSRSGMSSGEERFVTSGRSSSGDPGRAPSGVGLPETAAAFSVAADVAMGQPWEQGLHTTRLALLLADGQGLSQDERRDVYYLALLRFSGCTAGTDLAAGLFGDGFGLAERMSAFDPARPGEMFAYMLRNVGQGAPAIRRARMVAEAMMAGVRRGREPTVASCEVAQRAAARLGLGRDVQHGLWQLTERWDGRGWPKGVRNEQISPAARIVHLAQDVVTLHRLHGREAALAMAGERADSVYDPALVGALRAGAGELLPPPDETSPWDEVVAAPPGGPRPLADSEFEECLRAMGDFTDLKSRYLLGHSRGVAEVARGAALEMAMPPEDVAAVHRSGLVHDLGRAGIRESVWEKEGSLTPEDWERVRLHAYLSERILARPGVLARLGAIAALHHERLDGSGYHRGSLGASIPRAARILAAADTYHAMREPRPHRGPRTPAVAEQQLRQEARDGRLDAEAVEAVLAAADRPEPAPADWPAGLSEREVEVLRLLARGLPSRRIGEVLLVASRTVEHHVEHIYAKLGVSTRAGAAYAAMEHRLLGELGDIAK